MSWLLRRYGRFMILQDASLRASSSRMMSARVGRPNVGKPQQRTEETQEGKERTEEIHDSKGKPSTVLDKRSILISGLPSTTIQADIERLLKQNQSPQWRKIQLVYRRLIPTGQAYIQYGTQPEALKANRKLLNAKIMGHILDVSLVNTPQQPRLRGSAGREEALQRGKDFGSGPDAGLKERGTSVCLWGLPGKLTAPPLRKYLKGFDLRTDVEHPIAKLHSDDTLTSRFLVRLTSVAEAHRLVRFYHMKLFSPESWGDRYKIHARVIY